MKNYLKFGMAGLCILAVLGSAGCTQKEEGAFQPGLDTQQKVVLNTTGFFGNFEALDMVTADFNQYYPNVEFVYEQVSVENYEEYLDANPGVDILMTSEEVFDKLGGRLEDFCTDLSKEEIDLGSLEEDLLQMGYHNGELSCIPMGQNLYGLIVNVSLLEKEGLSVPSNYEEFLEVLAALKEKGYVPIQGPDKKVYAELTQSMVYDLILQDQELYANLMAGNQAAADALLPAFDILNTFIENGYTDQTVNESYPADNYDQAILRFFEGDVPFWVCNTEKVSGMKKRESKSEAFQANPFEYTYIYAPIGEKGVYAFREPWFGFAVNKYSDEYDYAMEFMRFLATRDEINKMADIKGVPSVAVEKSDVAIYKNVLDPEKAQEVCVNDGTITPAMVSAWYSCTNLFATGEITSAREALEFFVSQCAQK